MGNRVIDSNLKHWQKSLQLIGLGRRTKHNLHNYQSEHIELVTR